MELGQLDSGELKHLTFHLETRGGGPAPPELLKVLTWQALGAGQISMAPREGDLATVELTFLPDVAGNSVPSDGFVTIYAHTDVEKEIAHATVSYQVSPEIWSKPRSLDLTLKDNSIVDVELQICSSTGLPLEIQQISVEPAEWLSESPRVLSDSSDGRVDGES